MHPGNLETRTKECNCASTQNPGRQELSRVKLSGLTLTETLHASGSRLLAKKDWNLTRAYSDVFKILSNRNTCSSFYGGPRTATTVLNDFFALVQTCTLSREVSFQMAGRPRLLQDPATGTRYRLFDRTVVNTSGSFYQRRTDPMLRYPSDVGAFSPGSRQARALILLHELGHLIQGENGAWLIPDDGYNERQSAANTSQIQLACRAQLAVLK